jgi:tol-pal system protein YbgF
LAVVAPCGAANRGWSGRDRAAVVDWWSGALFSPKTLLSTAVSAPGAAVRRALGRRSAALVGERRLCGFPKDWLMIRRPMLPRACPGILFVFLMIMSAAAQAQDATTQDRLDRLERDLSMLQRQVYRSTGGEAPAGAESGSNAAVDLQVRMDRLEQQMRDLTGRVEDETNQFQQLSQRLEQINSDIDVRLGQVQTREGGPALPPRPPVGAFANAEASPYADTASMPPYRRPPPPPPPPGYGTLTPPGSEMGAPPSYNGQAQLTPPPMASAGGAETLRPPGSDTMPAGSASEQYNAAFGLLRQADYQAAEEALRTFVQQHPNDPLAGNAQYWLGESFYVRGRYSDAAAAFADGYKRYPRGPKAADSLLELGKSLARADQRHNACIALMQLDHDFPHPSSAIKERAMQEKKRLGC